MAICFVIQPFDKGRFDKRYQDVFKPAVEDAGLEPYRVDQDPSTEVPIESIASGIRSASVCLADITLDNPNVWFELGFAISSGKSVIMVCSTERATKFPFDVQHRSIIQYECEAPRDFEELKGKITKRLLAALEKAESLGKLVEASPLRPVEGLSQFEIVALAAIAENLTDPSDSVSVYIVKKDIEASGYTRMAAMLGSQGLIDKSMVTIELVNDGRNFDEYKAYCITPKGWQWIVANQNLFQLKRAPRPTNDEEPSF